MMALAYYSVTLLPVIGIVQISTIKAADRYTYLTTIPLYLLVGVFVYLAFTREPGQQKTTILASPWLVCLLVISIGLGFGTHQYSKVWQSDITLWEFVQEKKPKDIHATIYLAEAYYRENRYEEALPLYQLAYINRQNIFAEQPLNKFINRYVDTAYRLGLYQEAELALFTGMQENRLWFLPPEEIFYIAALINLELARYETAQQLLQKALQTSDDKKLLSLQRHITELLATQP